MAAKKHPPRPRSDAQIAAERRRNETNPYGQTSVRHDEDSYTAMNKVAGRLGVNGPEAMRYAIIEIAKTFRGKT